MQTHKKRFTKEEDLVILSEVKANPQNLSNAFRIASKKINRSFDSISLRWYSKLRKRNAHCFVLLGKSKYLTNMKNSNSSIPIRQPKFKRILKIIFE